jgi:hypothetical protein
MQTIDKRILELKGVEKAIENLTKQKEDLRKEIFGIVENEGLTDGYKNEDATVSYVERKAVKIKDEQKLLDDLIKQKVVKYFKEVPAHLEITTQLTKDVKEGVFSHPEVEVETSNNLAIRFNA